MLLKAQSTGKPIDSIAHDKALFCIGYTLQIKKLREILLNQCVFQMLGSNKQISLELSSPNGQASIQLSSLNKYTSIVLIFKSFAIFNGIKFLDKADFYSDIFLGEYDFTRTAFKRVSFSEAGFSKEANFRHVNFVDEAEFSDTIFCSGANFYRSIFSNATYFSAIFKSETFFNYVRFENPSKITFESEDMSKVSFINTNITKITFNDKTTWSGKDKFTIIEEKWLEDSGSRKNNIEKRTKVSLGASYLFIEI